ncbi:glycosyltransferase family 2 protein [Nocardioides jensenii]|uniref:glycosyltransferase family 2 protein n=1 Tax=Nocardioides jensenii TaxID=1843 RepID=UPI00082F50E7|nr:glycosyltransferase family 2 protein [Nocardioides jensenii]
MPVLNEERYLEESVRRVLDQAYDGEVELVLAVGPSKDRTAEIAHRLAATDPQVSVVGNPTGFTPHALNAAIAETSHPFVVRVDAHGFLPDGYLEDVVDLLESTGAANVGGMMRVEGDTSFGHAVAAAMSSPLGIGGSKFHVGGEPGPARTVYLGSFRRDALVKVGGFDEHFLRAQDWELNYRLRQAGETVWFTPDLAVVYRPRRDFNALRRQFFGSGQWRRQIVDEHPDTASFRYLAAPIVTGLIALGSLLGLVGLVLGLVSGTVGPGPGAGWLGAGWLVPWLLAGFLAPLGYAFGVLGATYEMGRRRRLAWRARVLLPFVVATMHLSWGSGFLRSIPRSSRR